MSGCDAELCPNWAGFGCVCEALGIDPPPTETDEETDDEFWGRLLGDDDPCAPGKDWVAAAFTEGPIDLGGAP